MEVVSSVALVRSGTRLVDQGHQRGVDARERGGEQISMTERRRREAVAPSTKCQLSRKLTVLVGQLTLAFGQDNGVRHVS